MDRFRIRKSAMQSQSTSVIIRECSTHFRGVLRRRGTASDASHHYLNQKRKQNRDQEGSYNQDYNLQQRLLNRGIKTHIRRKNIAGGVSGVTSISELDESNIVYQLESGDRKSTTNCRRLFVLSKRGSLLHRSDAVRTPSGGARISTLDPCLGGGAVGSRDLEA